MKKCYKYKLPLIIGSTGHTSKELNQINDYKKRINIITKQNFSLGIDFLIKCIQQLNNFNDMDISIFECHHKTKIDKPSGTALLLAEEILKNTKVTPEILSSRLKDEVGTHKITIRTSDEIITISHQALSRTCFSSGAINLINNNFKKNR